MNEQNNVNPVVEENVQPQVNETPVVNESPQTSPKKANNMSIDIKTLFMHMLQMFYKPITAHKNNKEKLDNPLTVGVFAAALSFVAMFLNFIKSAFAIIFVKEFDIDKFKYVTKVDFGQLKELEFLKLIFGNLFFYLIGIAVIAGIFYLAGLIFKKKFTYFRSVLITTSALLPVALVMIIVAPIFGLVWYQLNIIISIIAIIYFIVVLAMLMNVELELEGDMKFYVNLVCFGLLGLIIYFVFFASLVADINTLINGLDSFSKLMK